MKKKIDKELAEKILSDHFEYEVEIIVNEDNDKEIPRDCPCPMPIHPYPCPMPIHPYPCPIPIYPGPIPVYPSYPTYTNPCINPFYTDDFETICKTKLEDSNINVTVTYNGEVDEEITR